MDTSLPPRKTRHSPASRQLWQVPTFLAGTLALLAVTLFRPLGPDGTTRQLDHELEAARVALGQSEPDLPQARACAERALQAAAPSSHYAATAHYLLGCAYLMEAERTPANASGPFWQQARIHLEQADALGIAEAERPRLAYRLGKTYHVLNADPQRVVNYLSWSVQDGAPNLFEGYALLAEAYLRLPTPDLRNALDATRKQLALPNADETLLAAPRLLCGELLCRLDQADEARKILARVGPGAAPEMQFRSRLLRARLSQNDGAWAEAARLWEEVKADPRWTASDPGRTLYYLGLCYRKLDQPAAALKNWEECRQRGGDEAQAAALEVALVRLRGEQPATALEPFAAALRSVAAPADYHNPLIDLSETRNRFEAGCQVYRQIGAYEQAQQLANLYERIALPGVGQELAGQAAEAWARSLLEQATQAVTDQAAQALREEAQQHFRDAGGFYERAADLSPSATEQADWLWHAAADCLEGRDRDRAVHTLERFVQLPAAPGDHLGQGWYLLGEAHRLLGNEVMAQAAYQKCIEYPGSYAFRARYELAQAKIEQKSYDDAEAELIDNFRLAPPGSEAHEKSLITLAMLQFQRHKYSDAIRHLQKALDLYPANAATPRLRLYFAQCCRYLAEQANEHISPSERTSPEEQKHYRDERIKQVERAALQYQKLAQDLEAISAKRALSSEEEATLRQSLFAYADCRFDLGRPEEVREALRLYNQLADRYHGHVEELYALRHVWQCHGVLSQPEQARTTLDRLATALKEMPAAAFDGTTEAATHVWWENWLGEMSKLRDSAKPQP